MPPHRAVRPARGVICQFRLFMPACAYSGNRESRPHRAPTRAQEPPITLIPYHGESTTSAQAREAQQQTTRSVMGWRSDRTRQRRKRETEREREREREGASEDRETQQRERRQRAGGMPMSRPSAARAAHTALRGSGGRRKPRPCPRSRPRRAAATARGVARS